MGAETEEASDTVELSATNAIQDEQKINQKS